MVFFADTRVDIKVELNANNIIELIEEQEQKKLSPDVDVEKDERIYYYVNRLECDYSNFVNEEGFYGWFEENYDNCIEWNDIMDLFEKEEEEDPCENCIVCVEKYNYNETGKMCLDHDPRDLYTEPKKLKFKVKKSP